MLHYLHPDYNRRQRRRSYWKTNYGLILQDKDLDLFDKHKKQIKAFIKIRNQLKTDPQIAEFIANIECNSFCE
jgi:hypothetical protein